MSSVSGGSGSLIAQAYVRVRTDLNLLRSDLGQATSMFRSAVTQMAGVAGGMLAAAGIRSFMEELRGVVGQFISVNNMFEQYQVSLGTLFKSDAIARNMIQEIQDMARKTPFRMDTLTQSIVQLKIFGIENEKLIPTMRAIGDAASASPRGMLDGVQRISYAIGEMHSHGRIMAAEMRQLASAGVPAWDLLAKSTGKSIGQIRDLMRKGAIDSKTYLPMLIEGMANRFSGMMEKQSKTWGGLYSTFQDNMMLLFKDVGRPFFDLAKLRLKNIVGFMDSPQYQSFLPRMTAAVRTISQLADRRITQAFTWLTGPSAANFAQKMRDVGMEVYRMSRVGEAKIMAFLGSDNVQTAVGWLADATVWMTRMAGIGFDNVMEFLRGDTWKNVVGGVKEYAQQLYGIGKIGFERAREFLQSKNFENLTEQAKKLFSTLMEVRKVVVDFAGQKMADGLAWLKGGQAAAFGSQIKAIAIEVRRIATISASNFWQFFSSNNLRLIAFDLGTAAAHIATIAGVKLVAFSTWLNSAEASAIAAGIRDITKNLVYLIDNYGGLALGIGIMVHFRGAILTVSAAFASLYTTINTGGLLALLSPQGLIIAGIVAIGAAFVASRAEGLSFFEYMISMLTRLTASTDSAGDAVTKLKAAIATEKEHGNTGGKVDEAMQGEASEENIAQLVSAGQEYAKQEQSFREVVRKKEEELRKFQRWASGDIPAWDRLLHDSGDNFAGDIANKKKEITDAKLDVDRKVDSQREVQERVAQRQRELDAARSQAATDAKVERDASRTTLVYRALNSGAGVPFGGMASELAPADAVKDRLKSDRDKLFNTIATATLDRSVGWKPMFGVKTGAGAAPNDKQAAWMAERDRKQIEYLEGKNKLSNDDKAKLDDLRRRAGQAATDDGAPGGSSKLSKKPKDSDFTKVGVVEFADALSATVNKTAADEAADATAGNTKTMADALIKIQADGVKIKNPPVATVST